LNDNLKFVLEILDTFSLQSDAEKMTSDEDFKKSKDQDRREMCVSVDAKHGVVFDQDQLQVNKISYGYIQIVTIKASLTFKIKQSSFNFDFTNPREAFGLLSLLYPFIQNLASITDAEVKLNEIILTEGYQT